MDYECEKGATRNFEPWREAKETEETEEERLNRLEEEENESAMAKLETKTLDSKREMMIADALDEIRTRNARIERKDAGEVLETLLEVKDDAALAREREEKEIEEEARRAFASADGERIRRLVDDADLDPGLGSSSSAGGSAGPATVSLSGPGDEAADVPSFKRVVKRKKALQAPPGLIRKKPKLLI